MNAIDYYELKITNYEWNTNSHLIMRLYSVIRNF